MYQGLSAGHQYIIDRGWTPSFPVRQTYARGDSTVDDVLRYMFGDSSEAALHICGHDKEAPNDRGNRQARDAAAGRAGGYGNGSLSAAPGAAASNAAAGAPQSKSPDPASLQATEQQSGSLPIGIITGTPPGQPVGPQSIIPKDAPAHGQPGGAQGTQAVMHGSPPYKHPPVAAAKPLAPKLRVEGCAGHRQCGAMGS